jgi:two-component system OmpR family response regulator
MSREVTRQGERIELQPKEFSLLELFLRHAGRVVTKTMILEHVYDFSFDPQTNVVDVLVHRLRGKVDRDFDAQAHPHRPGGGLCSQGGLSASPARSASG